MFPNHVARPATAEEVKNRKNEYVKIEILEQNNYRKNADGSYDILNSLDLYDMELTELPFKINYVNGYMNIAGNNFTSLVGFPKKINGWFDCSINNITSLEGGPEEINGAYECQYNQLTSLKGIPYKIKGSFDCNNNELTSLEYGPS